MVWTRNQEKELESASVEKKQPLNNHASDNQGELRKYLETNKMETQPADTYGMRQEQFWGIFTVINVYIKRKERSQTT